MRERKEKTTQRKEETEINAGSKRKLPPNDKSP